MLEKLNWGAIQNEEVTGSLHRKLVTGDKMMIARLKLGDGCKVPMHQHHNEQITQVISGTIRFWLGPEEEQLDLHAGDILVIPSDLPHAALAIGDVEALDTFSPPRQDWLDGTDDYLRSGINEQTN